MSGAVQGNRIVYGEAQADTDVIIELHRDGVEEFRLLRSASAPREVRYELRLSHGASARCQSNQVEILDTKGEVTIRTKPAFALDNKGTRRAASVRCTGTEPRPTVVVSLDTAGLAFPILLDPAWISGSGWPGDSVVGLNSVQIGQSARVEGDVAVTTEGEGPFLVDDAALVVRSNATVLGNLRANTVLIQNSAEVHGGAAYNELVLNGSLTGERTTPLALPLDIPLPEVPSGQAGTEPIAVDQHGFQELEAGAYGDVLVRGGSVAEPTRLLLEGGDYRFASLTLENHARVECAGPCRIVAATRVTTGTMAYVGPAENRCVNAADVELFVLGEDAPGGAPPEQPVAASFGAVAEIRGRIFIPAGTLRIGQEGRAEGVFVGRDVDVGVGVEVARDSGPFVRDDGNPCTIFSCDATSGKAIHTPVPEGTVCLGANICEGAGVCNAAGECEVPEPPADDDNPCIEITCDPVFGFEHTPRPAGFSCSDGDACNGEETCDGEGQCVAGVPPSLDDFNPCTVGECDSVEGVTHHPLPEGTSCSDGDVCNGEEICDGAGRCLPGIPIEVDDGNPCTFDFCLDGPVHVPFPSGTPCSDGDACNGLELCDGEGICLAGEPPEVDDGDPCTTGGCDPQYGVFQKLVAPGTECSDGNACNGLERCDAFGRCLASEVPEVDDGNPCTVGHCDPLIGVVQTPVAAGTSCDDGDLCNGIETCDGAGTCLPGTPPDLDDGDPCTEGRCDPLAGVAQVQLPLGTPCDPDGNPCTGSGICSALGTCVLTEPPPLIDDGNPCTIESCDPETGNPVHEPVPAGTPCDDDDLCTGFEQTCDGAGLCVAAVPAPDVDDGNPCTADACVPGFGPVHEPLPPGTRCGAQRICDGDGECVPGVHRACELVCEEILPPDASNAHRSECLVTCAYNPCEEVFGEHRAVLEACFSAGECGDEIEEPAACFGACPFTIEDVPLFELVRDGATSCVTTTCSPEEGRVTTPLPADTPCELLDPCAGPGRCNDAGECLPLGVPQPDGAICHAIELTPEFELVSAPGFCVQGGCLFNGALCGPEDEVIFRDAFACGTSGCECDGDTWMCQGTESPCGPNPCLDDELGLLVREGEPCSLGPCYFGSCDAHGRCQVQEVAEGVVCSGGDACEPNICRGDLAFGGAFGEDVAFTQCLPATPREPGACTELVCDDDTGALLTITAPAGTACPVDGTCDGAGRCVGCGPFCAAQAECEGGDSVASCTSGCQDALSGACGPQLERFLGCAGDAPELECSPEDGSSPTVLGCEQELAAFDDCNCCEGAPGICNDGCFSLERFFIEGFVQECELPGRDFAALEEDIALLEERYVDGQCEAPLRTLLACVESGTSFACEADAHFGFVATGCEAELDAALGCAGLCDDGNPCTTGDCGPDRPTTHPPVAEGTPCGAHATCNADGRCIGCSAMCAALEAEGCSEAGIEVCEQHCLQMGRDGLCSLQLDALLLCAATATAIECPGAGVEFEFVGCEAELDALLLCNGFCRMPSSSNPCTEPRCIENQIDAEEVPKAGGEFCWVPCEGTGACDGEGHCTIETPVDVDDGNPCTVGVCDPESGSVTHVLRAPGSECSDGDPCNGLETCDETGVCQPGDPEIPDDGNPCTVVECDPMAGPQVVFVAAGTACPDGDACNGEETCDGEGVCQPGLPPSLDDGNPCTRGICDPDSGVAHVPLSPEDLDDGDGCTVGTCDPVNGIQHVFDVDDGNPCTIDTCETDEAGRRVAVHTPVELDDGNPCTQGSCSEETGLVQHPLPSGTSCGEDRCAVREECDGAGQCLALGPVELDDGNPCTRGSCDPVAGVRHDPAPAGTSCDDGDLCNGREICDGAGTCLAGVPPPIDDGNSCTVDTCDPVLGVRHEWIQDPPCAGQRSTWVSHWSAQPSPRDSAAMAFDPIRQRVIVFGGENAGVALGDTWILDRASNTWTVLQDGGPSPRAGASLVYDAGRDRFVLFGGARGVGAEAVYLFDTWELDPVEGRWEDRESSSVPPPGRAYASMAYDHATQRVVLFGGTALADLDDTWEWDGVGGSWRRETPLAAPSPRGGAAMVYDTRRGRLVLFGGAPLATVMATPPVGDTWEYNAAAAVWEPLPTADGPDARTGHAMTYDSARGRVVLFGGTRSDDINLEDTWELDESGFWIERAPLALPGPRTGHAMAFDEVSETPILFGGLVYSATGRMTPAFGDVWEFAADEPRWRERTVRVAPAALLRGAAYDSHRNQLVAEGIGARPVTWELDSGSGRWEPKDGFAGAEEYGPSSPAGSLDIGSNPLVYSSTRQRTIRLGTTPHVRVREWDGTLWRDGACPASPPSGRQNAAVAHDPEMDRVYLFGGGENSLVLQGARSRTREIWELDVPACAWSQRPVGSQAALVAREGAAAAWLPTRRTLIVFGGFDGQQFLGDTWEWSPEELGVTQLSSSGPSPRSRASLGYDPRADKVILFGGMGPSGLIHDDTWRLDPTSGTWTRLWPEQTPPPRRDATLLNDPRRGRLLLVGGSTGTGTTGGPLADVWEWDGAAWERLRMPAAPSARSGAAGGWIPHRGFAVLFGGTSGDGRRSFLQDTWVWSGGWGLASWFTPNQSGRVQSTASPQAPAARTGHAFAVGFRSAAQSFGLLFGGEGDAGLLGDTWTWNDRTLLWEQAIRHRFGGPAERTEHAMALVPGSGYLLFGGRGAHGLLSDTWLWFAADWRRQSPANSPGGRWGHGMATDVARNVIVLFGGHDESAALADTWEYDLGPAEAQRTWVRREPILSPQARFGHTLTYDFERQRILLLGGAGNQPDQSFEDVWEWMPAENTWRMRDPQAQLGARAGHAAFVDGTGETVVFGGLSHRSAGTSAVSFADTWVFQGADGIDDAFSRRPDGVRCEADTECRSGLCVDGFCCNSRCSAQCGACDVAGSEGRCVAVTGSPHGGRTPCDGPGGECGRRCNGSDMTACHVPASGSPCGPEGCIDGVLYERGVCDGSSACIATQQSCAPYACRDAVSCGSVCTLDADCFSDQFFCTSRPGLPVGQCRQKALLTDVTVSPMSPVVGEAVAVTASQTGSLSPRYLFSYAIEGIFLRTYPCGSAYGTSAECLWIPTEPGEYFWRVEVRDSASQSNNDVREFTVIVGVP